MESKSTEKQDENTTKYLVSYRMKPSSSQDFVTQKFEATQIVIGDLEPWYKQLCVDNPKHEIVVTVACLIW